MQIVTVFCTHKYVMKLDLINNFSSIQVYWQILRRRVFFCSTSFFSITFEKAIFPLVIFMAFVCRRFVAVLTNTNLRTVHCFKQHPGADPKISERGGRNVTFQCHFQSFSYKSLTNTPPKGGAVARPAPPLNLRLTSLTTLHFQFETSSFKNLFVWRE